MSLDMASLDRRPAATDDPSESHAAPVSSQSVPFVLPIRTEGYAPDPRSKVFAFVMTGTLYLAALIICLMSYRPAEIAVAPPPRPLVVTLLPLSPPAAQVREHEHHPRPMPEKQVRSQPAPKIPAPSPQPASHPVSLPVAPMVAPTVVLPSNPPPAAPPPVTAQTAAESAPAKDDAPGKAKDSWEGRVLARLERFKRYPSAARSRREQGVATIRFRLDRQGRVLSSSIAQSSGNAILDQEALATLARAEPLPPIPAGRPGEVELIVPVEFSLHHP